MLNFGCSGSTPAPGPADNGTTAGGGGIFGGGGGSTGRLCIGGIPAIGGIVNTVGC